MQPGGQIAVGAVAAGAVGDTTWEKRQADKNLLDPRKSFRNWQDAVDEAERTGGKIVGGSMGTADPVNQSYMVVDAPKGGKTYTSNDLR